MIKPEELRMGNLVSSKRLHSKYAQVSGMIGMDVWLSYECDGEKDITVLKHFEIEPIPLTEELLVNAGFVGNKYLRKDGFIFAIWKRANGFYLCVSEDDDDCIEIKYFHHIQNICRDFGTELTIKL